MWQKYGESLRMASTTLSVADRATARAVTGGAVPRRDPLRALAKALGVIEPPKVRREGKAVADLPRWAALVRAALSAQEEKDVSDAPVPKRRGLSATPAPGMPLGLPSSDARPQSWAASSSGVRPTPRGAAASTTVFGVTTLVQNLAGFLGEEDASRFAGAAPVTTTAVKSAASLARRRCCAATRNGRLCRKLLAADDDDADEDRRGRVSLGGHCRAACLAALLPSIMRVAGDDDQLQPSSVTELHAAPNYKAFYALPAGDDLEGEAKRAGHPPSRGLVAAPGARVTHLGPGGSRDKTRERKPHAPARAPAGAHVGGAVLYGTVFGLELRGFTVDSLRQAVFSSGVQAARSQAVADALRNWQSDVKPTAYAQLSDLMWDGRDPRSKSFIAFATTSLDAARPDPFAGWTHCGTTLAISMALLDALRAHVHDAASASILRRLARAVDLAADNIHFEVLVTRDARDVAANDLNIAARPVTVLLEAMYIDIGADRTLPQTELLLPLMYELLPRSVIQKWLKSSSSSTDALPTEGDQGPRRSLERTPHALSDPDDDDDDEKDEGGDADGDFVPMPNCPPPPPQRRPTRSSRT